MPNTLGLYDPLFYANEALIQLEKALGMAARVHRGYEKSPQEKGSTINIRRPTSFVAQPMPISAGNTSDINPDSVAITLDQWHGVQFGLTDKELAYTKEQIIDEHIRPAAVAVADKIDQSLVALYKDIPWFVAADTSTPVKDFTNLRQRLFDNKVPLDDLHYMIGGAMENVYLAQAVFHQANTSSQGSETQRRGTLGEKFGFETFANQNVLTHAATPITFAGAQANAQVNVGDTTIAVKDSDAALAGTIEKGAIISDGTYNYAVTADATAVGNVITCSVTPKVKAQINANAALTITQPGTKVMNLAFHRGAFALAMAPLPDMANELGAKIATVVDPLTGLALRSRMFYDGFTAKTFVSIDALWGVKTLNPDMAARLHS
jgi:hypothetical protein